MNQRCQKQGRIRGASTDDHIRPGVQCRDQPVDPDIGICRHQPVAKRGSRCAGFVQHKITDLIDHIVTRHGCDPQPGQAKLARDGTGLFGGGTRVRRAHVGHDPRAIAHTGGQHGAHAAFQQGVIAFGGVLSARLLGKRDRPLAQTLENQVVKLSALGQVHRGCDTITLKSGTGPQA